MFKLFKAKENFPTTLFVFASLSALLLFIIIMIISQVSIGKLLVPFANNETKKATGSNYIAKNSIEKNSDQLITKVPSLKDIIKSPIISNIDPNLGNPDSPIKMVIFSDFKCQHCKNQEEVLKMVMKKYNLRLIWKDFPESDEKSLSFQAAVGGRCAQAQDLFWEYHDQMFSDGSALSIEKIKNVAKKIGLNEAQFSNCLNSEVEKNLVRDNIEEANTLEITGIPFMFVNEQEIMGEATYDELVDLVKQEAK